MAPHEEAWMLERCISFCVSRLYKIFSAGDSDLTSALARGLHNTQIYAVISANSCSYGSACLRSMHENPTLQYLDLKGAISVVFAMPFISLLQAIGNSFHNDSPLCR